MQKLLISIAVIVLLCVFARVAIHFVSMKLIATGLTETSEGVPALAGCGDKLNCISSTATNARKIQTFKHTLPDDQVIEAITQIIREQPGTTIVTQTDHYVHATYKTLLLGYTDDVEILLDTSPNSENAGSLQIRSASRIGQSDLGANRKRLEALRLLVDGQI